MPAKTTVNRWGSPADFGARTLTVVANESAKRNPSFDQALEPAFIRMKDACFAFEPTVHRDMIDVVIKHILTTP